MTLKQNPPNYEDVSAKVMKSKLLKYPHKVSMWFPLGSRAVCAIGKIASSQKPHEIGTVVIPRTPPQKRKILQRRLGAQFPMTLGHYGTDMGPA